MKVLIGATVKTGRQLVRRAIERGDEPVALVRAPALTDLQGFHGGKISRADVAALCLDALASGAWAGKTPLIMGE